MITSTAERLCRHELIGLGISVTQSLNPLHLGIKGTVVDETRNMLVIASNGKKKYVPKADATYCFTLFNGTLVQIDGRQLLGRPVDRIARASGRRSL